MLSEGSASCKSAGWLPVTLASLMTSGVIVAYIWAVVRKDVEAWIPYISEAGGNPPQSGVFAIFLYLSATIGLVTMMVRYTSIHRWCFHKESHFRIRLLNHVGLFLGLICLVGMIVVASYPVLSERKPKSCTDNSTDIESKKTVLLPHTMGAMFIFVIGIVFAFAQAVLSIFLVLPISPSSMFFERKWLLFGLRTGLCIFAFAALLVMVLVKDDRDRSASTWVSTGISKTKVGAEWILALMLILLFLTLYPEMKMVGLEVKTVTPTSDNLDRAPSASESIGSTSHILAKNVVYT